MILSDRCILQAIDNGDIEIEPFDRTRIQPCSVDATLHPQLRAPNPATTRIDVRDVPAGHTTLVDIPDSGYVLRPGAAVLGATAERIRLGQNHVARAEGKALALNTEVPTPTGWTTIADIQPGDEVFGADGRPTTVVRVSPIYLNESCFRIRLDDSTTITADANHRWLTWDSQARDAHAAAVGDPKQQPQSPYACPKVRTTREIAETLLVHNGEQNHAIQLAALDLPDATLPLDPYILGTWLGKTSDVEPAGRELAMAGSVSGNTKDTQNTGFGFTSVSQSGRMFSREHLGPRDVSHAVLQELGVFQNKHIPMAYLRASKAQRLALLQGLMDTNGHLRRGSEAELSLTLKRLADDTADLIVSLGMKVRRDEHPTKLNDITRGMTYRSQFRLLPLALQTERKENTTRPDVSQTSTPEHRLVHAADPVASVPVKCIEVAATDGLFLVTRSLVPTHNSSLGRLFLAVHVTAGFVDAGWPLAHITLEIVNLGPAELVLHAGMPICQFAFETLSSPPLRDYSVTGRYGSQEGPTESRYGWSRDRVLAERAAANPRPS